MKIFSQNKKAFHDYFVEKTFEAGIVLSGTEVKSIRLGHVNIKDSYVIIKKGQAKVLGIYITPYEKGNIFNKDPIRDRILLLHKKEIKILEREVIKFGYTSIPLKVYLKRQYVKIEIGLCRGKKKYDKRYSEKEKEVTKKIQSKIKEVNNSRKFI